MGKKGVTVETNKKNKKWRSSHLDLQKRNLKEQHQLFQALHHQKKLHNSNSTPPPPLPSSRNPTNNSEPQPSDESDGGGDGTAPRLQKKKLKLVVKLPANSDADEDAESGKKPELLKLLPFNFTLLWSQFTTRSSYLGNTFH